MTIAAATAATEHGQAALNFDSAETLTVPPGAEAACDPTDLPVTPDADLILSLYLPEETGPATYSHKRMQTAHIAGGNHVNSPELPGAEQVEDRFYVSGVDVLTPDDTAIAVAFGDSRFEGFGSRKLDGLGTTGYRGWLGNDTPPCGDLNADQQGPVRQRRDLP